MNINFCRGCGKKIPKYKQSNALYCGDYCKKRNYDNTRRNKTAKTAQKRS